MGCLLSGGFSQEVLDRLTKWFRSECLRLFMRLFGVTPAGACRGFSSGDMIGWGWSCGESETEVILTQRDVIMWFMLPEGPPAEGEQEQQLRFWTHFHCSGPVNIHLNPEPETDVQPASLQQLGASLWLAPSALRRTTKFYNFNWTSIHPGKIEKNFSTSM